jgi:hypothetical protein
MRSATSLVALTLLLVPAVAKADPLSASPKHAKPARTARVQKAEPKTCMKPTVEIAGAGDTSTFSLAKCDGSAAPLGVDQLSLLARPASAPKPKVTIDVLAKSHGPELAPGIRRVDSHLVERLELVVDHFHKAGAPTKIVLVSGYRPKSAHSYHQSGKALDFRLEGVDNEQLVAFCKTLPDTGCGYYPNSSFVHMDVRKAGTGHVAWIDVSHPGEAPKYVSAWPTTKDAVPIPALPRDEQPALSHRAGLAPHPYFF